MGGLYTDPEDGILRMRTWWGDVENSDPERQPKAPTLIRPDFVDGEAFADLAGLGRRLAELLDGHAPILTRTVATLDGYDSFPAFTIYAQAQGAEIGQPAALYVGCIAVQKAKAEDVVAAIGQALQGRAA